MSNAGDPRSIWNQLSADFQARQMLSTSDVSYGPLAPPERELGLLGLVRGQRVLDVGCGGGQACLALARQGAVVTGLDASDRQLAVARELAQAEKASVTFLLGPAEDLAAFGTGSFDLVLAIYVLHYIADIRRCLGECSRVLSAGGRLVFSLDHPLRDCFFDGEENALADYPVRSYFDDAPMRWQWPSHNVTMRSYHRTVGAWVDLLAAAGLRIARIVEPLPPVDVIDELWPEDGALAALRCIPHTIIFVAEKP